MLFKQQVPINVSLISFHISSFFLYTGSYKYIRIKKILNNIFDNNSFTWPSVIPLNDRKRAVERPLLRAGCCGMEVEVRKVRLTMQWEK